MRVEALVTVEDPALKQRIDRLLRAYLDPSSRVWHLGGDGSWTCTGHDAVQSKIRELGAEN
jgi:polyphosphate kinase